MPCKIHHSEIVCHVMSFSFTDIFSGDENLCASATTAYTLAKYFGWYETTIVLVANNICHYVRIDYTSMILVP